MKKIPDNILAILGRCRIDGNVLFLPNQQLERSTYLEVNKVLENIGDKWNRKAQGHVFADGDSTELLNNVLMTGTAADLKKEYQFFPTPRPVAEQMCRMAELDSDCRVLEPSCGKGDLADVIYEYGVKDLLGLELNGDMQRFLAAKPYQTMTGVDFLQYAADTADRWPRIIVNPPFTRQQDIDHILAAFHILTPGGILVSVVSEAPFFGGNKKAYDFRELLGLYGVTIVSLQEGAFRTSGTMIRTRIIKMKKPF